MQPTKIKRFWCTKCKGYHEFTERKTFLPSGDNLTYCEGTIKNCKNCGYAPLFDPKPEPEGKEDGEQGSQSNS